MSYRNMHDTIIMYETIYTSSLGCHVISKTLGGNKEHWLLLVSYGVVIQMWFTKYSWLMDIIYALDEFAMVIHLCSFSN